MHKHVGCVHVGLCACMHCVVCRWEYISMYRTSQSTTLHIILTAETLPHKHSGFSPHWIS